MVTDPSLCPIPPGFEVIGGFNDDFENFRNHSPYNTFGDFGANIGVSRRWKNPNIRSVGIVCGFQFKIGPNVGERFQVVSTDPAELRSIGKVKGGDIVVHLPRRHGPSNHRGSYVVALKWYTESDRLSEEYLDKEIPHDVYGSKNYFRELNFRGQPNPGLKKNVQIRDGQWHSFLAVIYNDYHRKINPQTSQPVTDAELFPTIGLWWSKEATSDFSKFQLLGMGADLGDMLPLDQLMLEIGDDQPGIIEDLITHAHPQIDAALHILDDNLFGDELFEAEHPLQIRIDDVPLNEIDIRNMYAASVKYIGMPTPPQGPGLCSDQAQAVMNAQAKVEELNKEAKNIRENMIKPGMGFGSPEFNKLREILENIQNVIIPNAISDLRATEFGYARCKDRLQGLTDHVGGGGVVGGGVDSGVVVGGGGISVSQKCEALRKAAEDAQGELNLLKEEVKRLTIKMSVTSGILEKQKIQKKIKDIVDNKVGPANDRVTAAKTAFDDCMKGT